MYPYAERTGRPVVPGVGRVGGPMIIGEAPGNEEAQSGKPFVGRSGQILRKTLRAAGINPDDCFITNAVQFHPPENRTPTPDEYLACRPALLAEIDRVKPTKILTVGSTPLSSLLGSSTALPITKHRGRSFMWNGIFVVPTVHPAWVLRLSHTFRDFADDIAKFATRSAPLDPPEIDVILAKTVDQARETLLRFAKASRVSLDLESTGLNPRRDELLLWGFGVMFDDLSGEVLVIPEDVASQMKSFLREFIFETSLFSGEIVFHNLKFDLKFLFASLGMARPTRPMLDTMLMHYALDERTGSGSSGHGLKVLAQTRLDIPHEKFDFDGFVKRREEGTVSQEEWESFIWYLSLDCYSTIRLSFDLERDLERESDRLMDLVRSVLIPGSAMLAEVEYRGAPIDVPYLEELRVRVMTDLETERGRLLRVAEREGLHRDGTVWEITPDSIEELIRQLPDEESKIRADAQVYFDLENDETALRSWKLRRGRLIKRAMNLGLYREPIVFNPASTLQVKELLSKLGHSSGSDKEALQIALLSTDISDDLRDTLDALLKFRLLDKVRSTYIDGLLASCEDDVVHSDYLVHGTATGRLSCTEPNLMNIPTLMGPEIRRAFAPPPGQLWVKADYSQLELRIAAYYSGDEEMLSAYREGRDIHREVAAAMFQKSPEDISHHERYLAKYVDFGVIYGRSARSLVEGWEMLYYEKELGGKRWQLAEAEVFRQNFLDQFMGLQRWIAQQHVDVQRNFFVETPLGRRRRWSLVLANEIGSIQRQAVNTPIQSLASDVCLTAAVRVHHRLDPRRGRIVALVHDEIDLVIDEDYKDECLEILLREMQEGSFPWILDVVPLVAEVEMGPSWGDVCPVTQ